MAYHNICTIIRIMALVNLYPQKECVIKQFYCYGERDIIIFVML